MVDRDVARGGCRCGGGGEMRRRRWRRGTAAGGADGRARGFDVAVPAAGGDDVDGRRSHPRCAARVLGGAEQLCAPGRLAVAPWSPRAAGEARLVRAGVQPRRLHEVRRRRRLASSTAAATGNGQSPRRRGRAGRRRAPGAPPLRPTPARAFRSSTSSLSCQSSASPECTGRRRLLLLLVLLLCSGLQ